MSGKRTGMNARIREAIARAGGKGATVDEIVAYVKPRIDATKTPLRYRVQWVLTEPCSAFERIDDNRFRVREEPT